MHQMISCNTHGPGGRRLSTQPFPSSGRRPSGQVFPGGRRSSGQVYYHGTGTRRQSTAMMNKPHIVRPSYSNTAPIIQQQVAHKER